MPYACRVEELDPDDSRPPYLQLVARLRATIASGGFGPGEQIPTQQTLSEQYGVSVGTVKSALAELRREGLIVTRHGKGSYVRTDAKRQGASGGDDLAQIHEELAMLTGRVEAVERRLDAD